MLAVAAQIVAYLAVAAALGFVVAWALRGALLRRREAAIHTATEQPAPQEELAAHALKDLQAQLAKREQRLAALQARLAALEAALSTAPTPHPTHVASAPVLESESYGDIPRFLEQLGVGRTRAQRGQEADPLTGNLFDDEAAPAHTLVRDDLKKIRGIGPRFERHLNDLGVHTYKQIALWNEADIAKYARELRTFAERIQRDEWVRSAREQHLVKYGERL